MSDLVLSVKLTGDGTGLVEVVGDGADVLDKFEKEARQAGTATRRTGKDIKSLGNETKGLGKNLLSLNTILGAAATLMGGKVALSMADDYKILQGRIRLATEATGDYASVSEKLFGITQKNGAALEGSVGLFQSLARTAPELRATNDEVLTLTNLVQQIGVVSGASTTAMSAGMLQFGQAMAGGVVRAEEMNSLLENIPELANQIAAGMGLTSGKLRLAVVDGKILSEDVFRVLLGQADDVQAKFESMPLSLDRAGQMLENSFGKVLASIDETVGATGTLAGGLQTLSQWMDQISGSDIDEALSITAVAVTTVSAAIATYYVASWAAGTLAQLRAATVATGVSVALGVQTKATMAQVAANLALTTSSRIAAASMAFLAGPAGIAIGAAVAIGTYMLATRTAASETEALTQASDDLNASMAGTAKIGITKQIENVGTKISEANIAIAGFENRIQQMRGAGSTATAGGIVFNENQIELEKAELLRLQQQLADLEATKKRIANLNGGSNNKPIIDEAMLESAEDYGKRMFELARQAYPEATQSAEEYGQAQADIAKQWLAGKGAAKQQYEAVRTGLFNEEQALADSYARRAETVAVAYQFGFISEVERNQQLLALEQQYQDGKLQIQQAGMTAEQQLWASGWKGKVAVVAGAMGSIAQFLMTGNKRQFEIGKMAARASIIADTAQAIMKAWGQGGPFLGGALATGMAAKGAMQLRNLNSTQFGSGGGAISAGTSGVASAPALPSISNLPVQQAANDSRGQVTFQAFINGVGTEEFWRDELIPMIADQVAANNVSVVSVNSRDGQDIVEEAVRVMEERTA